jgi:hypothetical protein
VCANFLLTSGLIAWAIAMTVPAKMKPQVKNIILRGRDERLQAEDKHAPRQVAPVVLLLLPCVCLGKELAPLDVVQDAYVECVVVVVVVIDGVVCRPGSSMSGGLTTPHTVDANCVYLNTLEQVQNGRVYA